MDEQEFRAEQNRAWALANEQVHGPQSPGKPGITTVDKFLKVLIRCDELLSPEARAYKAEKYRVAQAKAREDLERLKAAAPGLYPERVAIEFGTWRHVDPGVLIQVEFRTEEGWFFAHWRHEARLYPGRAEEDGDPVITIDDEGRAFDLEGLTAEDFLAAFNVRMPAAGRDG
jgi:hypothetical protein